MRESLIVWGSDCRLCNARMILQLNMNVSRIASSLFQLKIIQKNRQLKRNHWYGLISGINQTPLARKVLTITLKMTRKRKITMKLILNSKRKLSSGTLRKNALTDCQVRSERSSSWKKNNYSNIYMTNVLTLEHRNIGHAHHRQHIHKEEP